MNVIDYGWYCVLADDFFLFVTHFFLFTIVPPLSFSLAMSHIPVLMKISSERDMVSHLKGDIKQLNFKLAQLQVLLEEKETQLHQLRR